MQDGVNIFKSIRIEGFQYLIDRYFNNNFSLGTFFISVFILSGLFTIFYGGSNLIYYRAAHIFAPTGIILISSISLLLTFLSLAFSLVIDNINNPNR